MNLPRLRRNQNYVPVPTPYTTHVRDRVTFEIIRIVRAGSQRMRAREAEEMTKRKRKTQLN